MYSDQVSTSFTFPLRCPVGLMDYIAFCLQVWGKEGNIRGDSAWAEDYVLALTWSGISFQRLWRYHLVLLNARHWNKATPQMSEPHLLKIWAKCDSVHIREELIYRLFPGPASWYWRTGKNLWFISENCKMMLPGFLFPFPLWVTWSKAVF